jgi:pantoate ligase/cytidylate kinase
LSLVDRARQENDLVVVSIFVNPLQFGANEDFSHYPRTMEQDQAQCQQAGVDVIFAPTSTELYGTAPATPENLTQVVPPASMMAELCGRFRPGHFPGVATVVTKLLAIVQPDRAYFGQKDAQQLAIIRRLVADLNLWVEIIGCPIVREPNGLALSSRNQYLSQAERQQATVLYRSLQRAKQAFQQGRTLREELLDVVKTELATTATVRPQYIELVHPETMTPLEQVSESGLLAVAAFVGSTRLIDNILLQNRKPIVAIDGPAGAGKSTVARRVAQALGLLYLDTGAMYRAVTWLALQAGISIHDEAAIAEMVSQCEIVLEEQGGARGKTENGRRKMEESGNDLSPPLSFSSSPPLPSLNIWINGHEVTQSIRSLEVTAQVSTIAAHPIVRRELVRQQQTYGRQGGIVMDGRDIGTHVFPDAEVKIFLTASVQERARRRQQELHDRGQGTLPLAELEQTIRQRDHMDSTRQIAPLRQAKDAIEIQTDNLSIDEVTAKIVTLYQEKLACLESDRL